MRRTLTIGALTGLALLLAACGPTSSSSSAKSGSSKSPFACEHWNNIKGDVSAGILTDAELRTKVSEVRGSATSTDVEAAATELLAGITANSDSKITSGARKLNTACS